MTQSLVTYCLCLNNLPRVAGAGAGAGVVLWWGQWGQIKLLRCEWNLAPQTCCYVMWAATRYMSTQTGFSFKQIKILAVPAAAIIYHVVN